MLRKSMYSEKFLKTKLLTSPFLVMLQTFFTRIALKGEIGHSKGTPNALGRSGTRRALGHSGSLALGHSKGTQRLGHLRHFI